MPSRLRALDDFRAEAGDEERNRLVDHIFLVVAEMLLRAGVDLDDVAVGVGDHHGIVHSRQKLAEKRLAVSRYK